MATRIDSVITVRASGGTHQTNKVAGLRASSTAGYRNAAQVLCNKLHPDRAVGLRRVDGMCKPGVEVFEVLA